MAWNIITLISGHGSYQQLALRLCYQLLIADNIMDRYFLMKSLLTFDACVTHDFSTSSTSDIDRFLLLLPLTVTRQAQTEVSVIVSLIHFLHIFSLTGFHQRNNIFGNFSPCLVRIIQPSPAPTVITHSLTDHCQPNYKRRSRSNWTAGGIDESEMTAVKNKSFKWSLDFTRWVPSCLSTWRYSRYTLLRTHAVLCFRSRHEKSADNVSPPGYSQSAGQNGTELSKDSESSRLIIKKSWDLALGPLKQVFSFELCLMFHPVCL